MSYRLGRQGRGLSAILFALACVCPAHAAENEEAQTASKLATEDAEIGFRNGTPIAVPIPFNDPTLGAGLTLAAGYLFTLDPQSKTSTLGAAVFKSDTGSQGAGITVDLSAFKDRWQGRVFLAAADLFYDVRVGELSAPIEQEAALMDVELRRAIAPGLSAGIIGRYLHSDVTVESEQSLPQPLQGLGEVEIGSIGFVAEWDRLDNDLYPTRGTWARLAVMGNQDLTDRPIDYIKSNLDGRAYWPLREKAVLATKVGLCQVERDTPFFDSCLLGGPDGIRGYGYFDHFGASLVVAQAEYRRRLRGRFGYAAFLGGGRVLEGANDRDASLKMAAGLGLRVAVSTEYNVDLSLDATLNDAGESYVYLYVGQGF